MLGKNVSAILTQQNLLMKCKDLGMCRIPCSINNTRIKEARLDLKASINVMPYSVCKSLHLGPLLETRAVIQLANRSMAYPKGIAKNVLVQVNELIFSTAFYVLHMENNDESTPILLGRPFLKTSKTKIDVDTGILTMEFDEKKFQHNIYVAMKYPPQDNSIYFVDIINLIVQDVFEDDFEGNGDEQAGSDAEQLQFCNLSYVTSMNLNDALLFSILQAAESELKSLPNHLKYMLLGDEKTHPVIIANDLTIAQEERLLKVLKEHKTAIGWTIADIKGLAHQHACIVYYSKMELNLPINHKEG
ncbi:hypothetical protein ACH5RR_032188 [Cinchona calisaya]|uniref:Uncharacterized protein n=1 Tax=Cinchona calisaya TaxID=153742 RepID=A0ABD2YIR3_9GENT